MIAHSNRIQQLFSQDKARIGFITAGDPNIQATFHLACALIAGGINLLEIGIPYSDPVADGPVIEKASRRALQNPPTPHALIALIEDLRKCTDIPIVLFTYLNPLLALEQHGFLASATRAGIDGVLIVDCPHEASLAIRLHCQQLSLDYISLISESTPVERIAKLCESSTGFIYYACRRGTTGIQQTLPPELSEKILLIKKNTRLPVVVGFGISSASMISQVNQIAEGAVVGSLFVKAIAEGYSAEKIKNLAQQLFL